MVDVHYQQGYKDAIRITSTNLAVFSTPDFTGTSIATLNPGTPVTLTGYVGNGIAQIKVPVLGWIDSSHLVNPKTDGRYEPGRDPYIVVPRMGLKAFEHTGERQTYNRKGDGPDGGTLVYLTKPEDAFEMFDPDTGITNLYTRVYYESRSHKQRVGYVNQGDAPPGQPGSYLALLVPANAAG